MISKKSLNYLKQKKSLIMNIHRVDIQKTLGIDLVESTIKIQLITFINSNGNIKVNLHFSAASYLIKS